MNVWSIAIVSVLLAASLVATWRHARATDDGSADSEPFSGSHRIASYLFGFFGIGAIPLGLALAVWWSTSAIAMAALDAIATLHLDASYPVWFPGNALATGLGVGLLSARLLAASFPSTRP